ncbi:MAG: hypothetical protein LBE18_10805 [Planctomycetaceae bacterium]|jgi:hypothetical protein|nr:hypothetical protein [Planctomycetaceae bacterium]
MKRVILVILFVTSLTCVVLVSIRENYGFGHRAETIQSLAQQFVAVPADDYKPHAWWHWLGSNFSKEGITKDLQAMKESNIGGVVVFNAPSWLDPSKNPHQNQTYRSVAYWDALKHTLEEAKRLNLTVGIHNTPGWSTTGGPWIQPENGMQAVTYNKTTVKGPQHVKLSLTNPKANTQVEKYFKDIALIAAPVLDSKDSPVTVDCILDISKHMDADGTLDWQVPEGNWIIYRVGHFPTLHRSHPAPEDVAEYSLEVDKMNPDATVKHWNNVLNPFIDRFENYIGSTFKYIWIDSYESGDQNWSPNFRAEFIRIKGYDPVLQLVTADMRGDNIFSARGNGLQLPKDAAPETKIFLRDYSDVINRLFMKCWQTGKEMVNKAGFTLCWEPYCSWGGGPFNMNEGVAIADVPVTEFWIHSGDVFGGETIAKAAASNGKRIVGAEAFTGMEATCKFTESPRMLKRPADMGFSFGVNLYFLHSWAHNPFDDKYQPGFNFAHYGTHFSRNQTWFEPGKAFFVYLARCQMLLQQGSFISRNNDVLHRRTPDADIFFVRNTGNVQEKTIEFPVVDSVPELWDAYNGVIKSTKRWKQDNNKIAVTLTMEKDASIFVVFPVRKTYYEKQQEVKVLKETPADIKGEWTVYFKPKTNEESFQKKFTELVDFSKQDDIAVKYFSGTAVYEKTIHVDTTDLSSGKAVILDLGKLNEIAELEVNGKTVGVLWHPPYQADITPILKSGDNTIKIHVTNNWSNRLIGDEQFPEDFEWTDKNQGLRAMKSLPEWFIKGQERPVQDRKTFIPWYYFKKESQLYPSGLLGPVKLIKQDTTKELN